MSLLIAIISLLTGIGIILFWPKKTNEEASFRTILMTGDPAKIMVIKSLFEEAEIPYLIKGEGVQDLFGIGRLGTGYNMITGPVRVQVQTEFESEARELLEDLESKSEAQD